MDAYAHTRHHQSFMAFGATKKTWLVPISHPVRVFVNCIASCFCYVLLSSTTQSTVHHLTACDNWT